MGTVMESSGCLAVVAIKATGYLAPETDAHPYRIFNKTKPMAQRLCL